MAGCVLQSMQEALFCGNIYIWKVYVYQNCQNTVINSKPHIHLEDNLDIAFRGIFNEVQAMGKK